MGAEQWVQSKLPPEIITPRLILRPPRAGDGPMVNEAIRESFDELSRWMEWAKELPTVEQTEAFARLNAEKYNDADEAGLWMIHRQSGRFIGGSGLPSIKWDVPSFEIGCWCRTSEIGKGYVTEATWAIAQTLFDSVGAKRVELRMDDRNARSWRVAERLGFELEAVLKRDSRANDGSLRDTRVYAAFSLAELDRP